MGAALPAAAFFCNPTSSITSGVWFDTSMLLQVSQPVRLHSRMLERMNLLLGLQMQLSAGNEGGDAAGGLVKLASCREEDCVGIMGT
jgi:hypothetical protein